MQVIQTDKAPKALGTYSQAIRCANTIYLSGQIPFSPKTNALCSEDIGLQINQVFDNLAAVCKEAGGSLTHIVSLTVYLLDLKNSPLVNEAMARYFKEPYPARVTIGVAALPRDSLVEIAGIMVLPFTS